MKRYGKMLLVLMLMAGLTLGCVCTAKADTAPTITMGTGAITAGDRV